ncbi:MAG: hypothetical protein LBK18_05105 [Prevotellaceae bacterium]|jgi:hypothetical protein|nr:hypothetical protein [Prevotellaceae bacterium]
MKYVTFTMLLLATSCTPMEVSDDVFEFFWSEMDRKYVYFDEKGVDWNAIYSAYHHRAKAADEATLLQVFREVIDTLKDGHVTLLTPDTALYYNYNYNVETYEVTMISISNYYDVPVREELEVDSCYHVFQLRDSITYIVLYDFYPMFHSQKFRSVMAGYAYSKGIIVNVMSNRGGYEHNVAEWSSCFFTGRRTISYEKHKIGSGHSDFTGYIPIAATGRGVIDEKIPVVLLTGAYTYSGANLFAAVMKYLPNVTLMGRATGGGGSVRPMAVLPNGWKYTYSQAPKYDIHYNSLEQGVTPHCNVLITREDMEEMQQTGTNKLMEAVYQYLSK